MIKRNVLDAEAVWWDVLFFMMGSAARYFRVLTLFATNVTVKVLSRDVIFVQILHALQYAQPALARWTLPWELRRLILKNVSDVKSV